MEDVLDLGDPDLAAVGRLHPEVMDPDAVAGFAGPEAEGDLGQHLEPHMLQGRQHVGEGQRLAGDVELEAQLMRPATSIGR